VRRDAAADQIQEAPQGATRLATRQRR